MFRVTVYHQGEEFNSALFVDERSAVSARMMLDSLFKSHEDSESWETTMNREGE